MISYKVETKHQYNLQVFPHESLNGEGESGGVEQDLSAVREHNDAMDITVIIINDPMGSIFQYFQKGFSNLGGKWEITLSNIPLKSCKIQIDEMSHQLRILQSLIIYHSKFESHSDISCNSCQQYTEPPF